MQYGTDLFEYDYISTSQAAYYLQLFWRKVITLILDALKILFTRVSFLNSLQTDGEVAVMMRDPEPRVRLAAIDVCGLLDADNVRELDACRGGCPVGGEKR